MIVTLYLLLFLVVAKYFKKKYGYLYNTNFFVTALWVVCALIAYWNPLGLIAVSTRVHIYSLLFLASFNFIGTFIRFPSIGNLFKDDFSERNSNLLWKRTKVIAIIALLAYSTILVQGLMAFLNGDYGLVKNLYYQEGVSYSYMYFFKVIPLGMIRCLSISSLFFYFRGGGRRFLMMSIFLMLMTTLSSMTRVDMVIFIIAYFYLTAITSLYKKISKVPLILGIGLMAVVSVVFRGNDFINSAVTYLTGSFSFLEYIIENPLQYDLNHLQYGYLTFASITEPIALALKVMGMSGAKTPEYLFNINCQKFVNISEVGVEYYNNNTTALYIFLYDFGPIGVVFGGIILGLACYILYKQFVKRNLWLSVIYLYVVVGLFTTTMSYNRFFGLMPLMVVLTSYYLTRNIKD